MIELSRYFFLLGGLPFIFLGVAHAVFTPLTPAQSKGLSPRDPAVRDAMMRDSLRISRRISVWRGWVGFNFSHSLGAALFGTVVLLIGRSESSFQQQAGVFLPFVVVVCSIYLILGVRYWFRIPILGISLSGLCFVTAWILSALP